jgi:hypothetical protein
VVREDSTSASDGFGCILTSASRFDLTTDSLVLTEPTTVTLRRKIHLQAFVKTDRKGIETASLGRTDLDSTKENHQSSGSLGSVIIDKESTPPRAIFVLDESLKDVENTVDDTMEGRKVTSIRGKGIETNSWISLSEGRGSLIVGKEAR